MDEAFSTTSAGHRGLNVMWSKVTNENFTWLIWPAELAVKSIQRSHFIQFLNFILSINRPINLKTKHFKCERWWSVFQRETWRLQVCAQHAIKQVTEFLFQHDLDVGGVINSVVRTHKYLQASRCQTILKQYDECCQLTLWRIPSKMNATRLFFSL